MDLSKIKGKLLKTNPSADWIEPPAAEPVGRHQDEHGNYDDMYTEDEALKLAKKEGIEFVDSFQIEGQDERYDSRQKAEAKAKKADNIIQIRERKPEPAEK